MGQNATFIKLKVGTKYLIGETSASINTTVDDIDTSSKASGLESDGLPGRVSDNISFDSMADETNAMDYGYASALAAMAARTLLTFEIIRLDAAGAQVSGSQVISGSGILSGLNIDNPDNAPSTFSDTIEVDDELTVTTYTPGP
jgi:hypothetical protein